MSGSNSTTYERRISLDQFPSWVLIIGLTFAMGSLNAEDPDTNKESETVVESENEKEKSVLEDTSEEDITTSVSTDQDEPASVDSENEETSLKQLIAKAQEVKSQNAQEPRRRSEVDSHLPKGDPSSMVIVVKGDHNIANFYDLIKRVQGMQSVQ